MKKSEGLRFILIILSFAAAISTCVSADAKNNLESQPGSSKMNEGSPLDWEGRYAGRIPAADGPGIDVLITLGSDQTFSLVYNYVGREDSFTGMGSFDWDETGNIIILKNSRFPLYYKVGKDHLRHLDIEGNEITGNLAQMYVLKKAE